MKYERKKRGYDVREETSPAVGHGARPNEVREGAKRESEP